MAVTRGPVPKRSDQRRRVNKPEVPVEKAPAAADVPVPVANAQWHATAKRWFEALGRSGQARFYEPSDWATAYVVAESMSRDLKDRVVGVTKEGVVVRASMPLPGATLTAFLKACGVLLVTEGDRRRVRLELQRPVVDTGEEGPGGVSELDDYRRRLGAG